jgi:hypothetical protein
MGLFDNTMTPLSMSDINAAIDATYVPNNPAYDYSYTDTQSFFDNVVSDLGKAVTEIKTDVGGVYNAATGTVTNWLLILVIAAVLIIFFASKSTKLKLNF